MSTGVSNRVVIALSLLAVVISVLGTYSVMTVTHEQQVDPSTPNVGHFAVSVQPKTQDVGSAQFSFEVREGNE